MSNDQGNTEQTAYEAEGHSLRREIKAVAAKVHSFIELSKKTTPPSDDSIRQNHKEMIANATLSYRHLESAAMRVGKSMQAYQGGVSILDKMRGDDQVSKVPDTNTQDGTDAGN